MHDYSQSLSIAIEAARAAGALLREEFHRPGGPRGQAGHAEADDRAEALIRERLLAAFPWDYRGEETGYTKNGGQPHLWLVDPNDGTSAYLKGRRGSSVSIAALRDGVPVLGVVFAFAYPDDEGDLIAWAEGCGPVRRNGQPVTVNLWSSSLDASANPPPVVFLSQDADRHPAANLACVAPMRYIAMPSVAYRLALAAVGEGVAAVSLNHPVSWDFAAGHALLRGVRGVLVGVSRGQPPSLITYTADGVCEVDHCFGGAPVVVDTLASKDWSSVFVRPQGEPPRFALAPVTPGQTCPAATVLTRAQGCLLGQLAGDALGSLVEFRSPDVVRSLYPAGCRDLKDGGTWRNLAGQPTDDSEMALILARTLVHNGRYDEGLVLNSYAHWWRKQAWDHGNTLRRALGPACCGTTTEERLQLAYANANSGSQSNGSLMRISPLGIFTAGVQLAGQEHRVVDWTRADSGLTHPNPVCRDACAVFVAAIAHAITTGCTAQECHAAALAVADEARVAPSVRQALETARIGPPPDYVTNMGWCLIALHNAFYQLLHAPSLEEGVIDTVMQGGDTDTTAAIAGALLGAVWGRDAIPPRWRRALLSCRPLPGSGTAHSAPTEYWPVDALELAEALLVCPA